MHNCLWFVGIKYIHTYIHNWSLQPISKHYCPSFSLVGITFFFNGVPQKIVENLLGGQLRLPFRLIKWSSNVWRKLQHPIESKHHITSIDRNGCVVCIFKYRPPYLPPLHKRGCGFFKIKFKHTDGPPDTS